MFHSQEVFGNFYRLTITNCDKNNLENKSIILFGKGNFSTGWFFIRKRLKIRKQVINGLYHQPSHRNYGNVIHKSVHKEKRAHKSKQTPLASPRGGSVFAKRTCLRFMSWVQYTKRQIKPIQNTQQGEPHARIFLKDMLWCQAPLRILPWCASSPLFTFYVRSREYIGTLKEYRSILLNGANYLLYLKPRLSLYFTHMKS